MTLETCSWMSGGVRGPTPPPLGHALSDDGAWGRQAARGSHVPARVGVGVRVRVRVRVRVGIRVGVGVRVRVRVEVRVRIGAGVRARIRAESVLTSQAVPPFHPDPRPPTPLPLR